MSGIDQPLHQHDHFGNVAGGTRLHVGRQAAERVISAAEGSLVALGDDPPGDLLMRGRVQNLVIDVSDVATLDHLVAVASGGAQPPDQDVEIDARPDMPDMRGSLHGRAAQVQRDLPRN